MYTITRSTTIDQHRGVNPATGLRLVVRHEVVTAREYDDRVDPRDHAERLTDELHTAEVELASLDADHRELAQDWLADADAVGLDAKSEAAHLRRAITWTRR